MVTLSGVVTARAYASTREPLHQAISDLKVHFLFYFSEKGNNRKEAFYVMSPHLEQTVLLHPIYVQSYEGLRKNENKEIHLETVSNI